VTEPSDAPSPPSAAPGSADVGRLVDGRYQLADVIGVGGMATVHRALDTKLGRPVAIKLLRREVIEDPDIAMRFRREALAATVLRHPNIVACLETGTDRGQPFLVMELIEGEDLAARLRRVGRLAPAEAARIGLDIARALSVAHVRGIVHRDVKPGNILLARDGRAMVTDFGIVRLAADAEGAVPGTTLGSVHYFSPEQATGATTTPASDVYSLGLVLYESLTGRRAWSGETTASLAAARVGSAAPSPRDVRPEIPAALDAIVRRALDPDPERRYPNGNAIAAALETLVGRPDPASATAGYDTATLAAAAGSSVAASAARPVAAVERPPVAPPLRPGQVSAPPRTPGRSARRASPAIAGPLVVLVVVAAVVGGGLFIAALPGRGDTGSVALVSPSPRATRTPSPRPTASPTPVPTSDPSPAPAKATPAPKPTPKPAAGSGKDLCQPFFGLACGLGKGTYAPATFVPAIRFTLGNGWSVATADPNLIGLARDTGVLTFASSIDTVYANGTATDAPASARLLAETFIETDGVASGKPKNQKVDKRATIVIDLAATGRDRIALFRTGDQTYYLEAGGTTRVYVIDVDGGSLVIAIEPAADSTIEMVLPAAESVVKSLKFR
jgi:serine/threonine protein kinase